MGNIYLATGTLTTMMTGEFAALANNAFATQSIPFDNTPATLGAIWGDFYFVANAAASMPVGNAFDLYIIPSMDGVLYPSTTQPPLSLFVGSFICQGGSTEVYALRNIPLPPNKFKAYIRNGSGVSLAGSGSTLYMIPIFMKNV